MTWFALVGSTASVWLNQPLPPNMPATPWHPFPGLESGPRMGAKIRPPSVDRYTAVVPPPRLLTVSFRALAITNTGVVIGPVAVAAATLILPSAVLPAGSAKAWVPPTLVQVAPVSTLRQRSPWVVATQADAPPMVPRYAIVWPLPLGVW